MNRILTQPVSVLMPVCNEVTVVEQVVEEWHASVFRSLPSGSELIFDDGESTDGTLEKLERLREKYRYIRILYSKKEGFAAAARRLYQEARCPLVFFTDSDGQYVADEFWKAAALIEGCDMAHGAKSNRQDPLYRKLASRCFNQAANAFFRTGLRDINSAFRLLSKAMVDDLLPRIHCMPTLFNAEMLLRAHGQGYVIRQVDVAHRPRKYGRSRGLPPTTFTWECCRAYQGLCQLRTEFNSGDPVPLRTSASPHLAVGRKTRTSVSSHLTIGREP